MMEQETRGLINDNHRRALSAGLGLLDEALCQFQRWAEGAETRSVLFEERNNLSPSQRKRINALISDLQARITELRDALGLERRVQSVSHSIRAQCSVLWESLVESESRYLRGYGEVNPEAAAYLDPKMEAIIDRLFALSAIADEGDASP